MESNGIFYYLCFLVWLLTALLVHIFIKTFSKTTTQLRPPPSPLALPLIGHLHLMSSVPVKAFQDLSLKYGPLLQLRLGASTFVLVSNAAVAKEVLKTHDLSFASRPEFGGSEYFIYRGSRFLLAPYGDYWRFMKKLCMTRLLSSPQIEKFGDIREEENVRLLESVMRCAEEGQFCDLSRVFTTLTNNVICRMAMSTRCSGTENEAVEIKELVKTCMQLSAKLSMGDILGPFKVFDFSGTGNKLLGALKKYDHMVERMLKEHEDKAKTFGNNGEDRKDLMDILLQIYADPNSEIKLSRNDIKSFLLDLFLAGTDTSSTVMQWAMGELINNPEILKKLQEEINSVVGTARLVKETDIPNLPYLQAVIRETIRLHTSAPLIVRECREDCKVNGFLVKANTRVLINAYAVMRDPDSWSDADKFIPERFLDYSEGRELQRQAELKNKDFSYIPFGNGRRACPGAALAMLVIQTGVGAMVQCFDWIVKEGDKVDLTMGSGFAAEMAHPLMCYPIKRTNAF